MRYSVDIAIVANFLDIHKSPFAIHNLNQKIMKTIMLAILLFLAAETHGQESGMVSKNPLYIDDLPFNEDGKLVFEEVVSADHAQDKLYLLSKVFFTKVFKSSDAVVQFDDRETATVIGKGFSEITVEAFGFPVTTRMFYTIAVQSKDNRYRYEISDIYFKSYPSAQGPSVEASAEPLFLKEHYYKKNGTIKPLLESYHHEMLEAINSLIEELVETMNFTKPIDDW